MACVHPSYADQGVTVRPTSVLAAVGLVIMGVIFADFVAHPQGTKAAANGLIGIEKPALNALLGQTSK